MTHTLEFLVPLFQIGYLPRKFRLVTAGVMLRNGVFTGFDLKLNFLKTSDWVVLSNLALIYSGKVL